jgi:hypothetical protein
MSSPGIRPRNNNPVASPDGEKGLQQTLRVLSADGAARPAAASIAMPRAKTELSELLAGDDLLCVRRRASATTTRPKADAGSGASAADVQTPSESPAALAAKRSADDRASSPRGHLADENLARVIDAWPGLPRNVRAAILAMIRETAGGDA